MHAMKITGRTTWLCAALMAASLITAQAQTTATWIGASGGTWNTAGNWDIGVPAEGTNAIIGVGANVNYNSPMAASSFGTLTDRGILNINAAGFNSGSVLLTNIASRFFVNSGGVVNVTGDIAICSNAVVSLATGGSLNVSGRLIIGSSMDGGTASAVTDFGTFTNSGGTLTASSTLLNPGNGSINTACRLFILGGVNNLGALTVNREPGGNGAIPNFGSDGMTISNGFVNTTSIILGNNAHGLIYFVNGIMTNSGTFTIRNATSTRPARFVQLNGLFVNADSSPINMTPSGTGDTVYSVLGGTNQFGTLNFGIVVTNITYVTNEDTSITATTNFTINPGVVYFTNAATIYVGGGGISSNGAVTVNASLNGGGLFGATADWTALAPLKLSSGTFTFQAAGPAGTAHNITLSAPLSGTGNLRKTGAGTLILGATNTYSGSTLITNGTLALGINGSLISTPINISTGAVFDVSAGGFTLGSSKTIAGVGTVVGAFIAGSGSIVSPGGGNAQGTLSFANGLTASDANFNIELTDDATGVSKINDAVNITGDLTASGTNIIVVTPVGSLGIGTYKLIKYTGNFNGGITNFSCAAGTLTNQAGEIDLIITTAHAASRLVWRGDGSANTWDSVGSIDWFNGVSLDRFYTGDTNIFDDTATNFTVNLAGVLVPSSGSTVFVNATNNYTFTGSGDISGLTGLTKTNSGKLTILTTNDYTGVTTISGGTLSVPSLANGGTASPIGAAPSSSANIVFNGGTLEYLGANTTMDRGATLQSNGGTVSVVTGTTLTLSGALTGPGSLTKIGNGQLTLPSGNDFGGGMIINAGSVRTSQGSGVTISALGTNTITLNGTSNITAFAFGGDQETLANNLNIIGSQNYITNSGNNTLSTMTGNGTVTLEGASGNVLSLQSSDLSGFSGTIFVDTIGNLRIFSGSTLNASNATINLGTGSAYLNNRNGNLTAQIGALIGGLTTELRGASSADGQSTYVIGGKNINTTFSGRITESTPARFVNIVKVGTGTLTLNGGVSSVITLDENFNLVTNSIYTNTLLYTGSTTISNGVLALAAPANLNTSTNITLAAPTAVLDVSQMGYADETGTNLITNGVFEVVSGQTLAGMGTIRGTVVMDSGSIFNGGLSDVTGILTVTNSITLGGTTYMKLSRGGSPSSDKLVSPSITLGGALVVTNIGSSLQVGDTFTLFSTPLNGTFGGNVTLPTPYTWDTSQLEVNGTITVTGGVPSKPTFGSVDFSQLANGSITFNATNGTSNGTFAILTSTNLALPLSSWTVIQSGNFDSSGNITGLSVTVTNLSQSFFILRTP